ncbi:Arginine kinase [Cyphomyrmex costatus]|uniref:Arginine kinase n=1 Tax=Cyphomyrmex costatus TaxID=456900 RepID=A0A151INR6_9HYME|nr:Arginine kinase [Cyphomyrmex costatus]
MRGTRVAHSFRILPPPPPPPGVWASREVLDEAEEEEREKKKEQRVVTLQGHFSEAACRLPYPAQPIPLPSSLIHSFSHVHEKVDSCVDSVLGRCLSNPCRGGGGSKVETDGSSQTRCAATVRTGTTGDIRKLRREKKRDGARSVGTGIRCVRPIKGYPFNSVQEALISLKDELKGTYYTLEALDKQIRQQLLNDHFPLKEGDRFLKTTNTIRF